MTANEYMKKIKDNLNSVEQNLEQIQCNDCISRQAVLNLAKKGTLISNGNYESVCKAINELPSVNPQEPCEDAISRADARHLIAETNRKALGCISTKAFKILYDGMDALPSVNPQPKTGRGSMTKEEQTISNLKKLKSFHNGSYGADIDRAIKALEQQSNMVSRSAYEQVMWERDVAIEQLKELGYEFGERTITDSDIISRKTVKSEYKRQLESKLKDDDRGIDLSEYVDCTAFNKFIDDIPPVNPQEPIDYKTQYESFAKKAEIVISQLRADRDRLADVLDKIRSEIEQDAFKDVNGSKYIFVNRINQIIDKYKAESEG